VTDLFEPCEFNGIKLQNRIAFSPTTRARAGADGEANELIATYYEQRASAGLLITEATAVEPGGRGGPNLPGLWDDKHIAAWKLTTDAVHRKGGLIFCQLWHAGRLSHSSLNNGAPPIAPSAMKQPGQIYTATGLHDYEEARALRLDEIPWLIGLYRSAAQRAKAAGFDGVELHGAHSYLIDAFVRDMTNQRTDAYGGSIENRARLLVEVMQVLAEVWTPQRTAIRLSPIGHAYGAWDSHPEPLFTHIVQRLNDLEIGWLDIVEGDTGISRTAEPSFDLSKLRKLFKGTVIANNLYTREMAIEARKANSADMIAFSRLYISNPDLVERLRANAPLNEPDMKRFYTPGPKGYTDYPTLAQS
jgi:N-ethylmaleimide reductase